MVKSQIARFAGRTVYGTVRRDGLFPSTLEMSLVMPSKRSACPQCETPLQDAGTLFCPKCSFPLMLIAGKYRLERTLEKGGFGTVYLAHHTGLTRDTERVIKVIEPGMFAEEESQIRFRREVELTSSLSQRNNHIVRIYDDFGREPELGYYYVMEYLRGKPLSHVMCPGKALHPKLIFLLMEQLCSALDAAHREDIVHRDLKPPNIFLIERDKNPCFVKILDFGIAKPLSDAVSGLTRHILGTPHYMSPEQCLNEPVDARSDLYALGMLFYHMSTGTHPFQKLKAGSDFAVMQAQISQPALSMREKRPDLPISEELDRVVLKAIEKDADDRYPTAGAFWATLRPFAPAPSSPSEIQGLLSEAIAIRALDIRRRNPVKPATVSLGPDDALSEAREDLSLPPASSPSSENLSEMPMFSPSSEHLVEFQPPLSPASSDILASMEAPASVPPPSVVVSSSANSDAASSAQSLLEKSDAPLFSPVASPSSLVLSSSADVGRLGIGEGIGAAHPKDTIPLDMNALDFLDGEARMDKLRVAMRSIASAHSEPPSEPSAVSSSPRLEKPALSALSHDSAPFNDSRVTNGVHRTDDGRDAMASGLLSVSEPPKRTTEDVLSEPPKRTTEDVLSEPPKRTTEDVLSEPPKLTTEDVLALQSAAPTEEVYHFVMPDNRPSTPSLDALSATVPVSVDESEAREALRVLDLAPDAEKDEAEEGKVLSGRSRRSRVALFVLLFAAVAIVVGMWTQKNQWLGISAPTHRDSPTVRRVDAPNKQSNPTQRAGLQPHTHPLFPTASTERRPAERVQTTEEQTSALEPPQRSLDGGQGMPLPEMGGNLAPDRTYLPDNSDVSAKSKHSASRLPEPTLMVFSRGDAERTGVYRAAGLQGFRRRVLWRKKTKGNVNTSPVVVGGIVYFGSDDGFFYAVHLSDGEEVWRRKIGARIASSPLVVDDMVYFGSWDHSLYALRRKDGATLWHHKAKGPIDGAPAADRDRVYFGSDDYHIYAVDRATGRLVWKYKTGRLISAAPTISGDSLYVGGNDGFLYAMDAQKGTERWRFQTKGRISGGAAVVEGVVYFGSSDQHVYAVDAATGKQRWMFETGGEITGSPAVAEKELYIGSHDGSVYALERASGKQVWRFRTRGKVLSSPAIWGEEVLFKSQDRYLYAVNMRTKRRHWSIRLGLSWAGASPVPADKHVLIGIQQYPAGLWAIQ